MVTLKALHRWDLTPKEMVALQRELAVQILPTDQLNTPIRIVAGVDVSYARDTQNLVAGVALLDADTLELLEMQTHADKATLPYIPGLFSFLELPPLLKALGKLRLTPDLILCDGHGVAHPRRFGLACHLGLHIDIPTLGCAKSPLLTSPPLADLIRGERAEVVHQKEVVGQVLCTRTNIKPVYVSAGHKISLDTACDWVLKLAPRYRLPETTRVIDKAVNALRKKMATETRHG